MLELIKIGRSIKSKGIYGAIKISLDLDLAFELRIGKFIFFDIDGNQVPFQIIEVDDGSELLLCFKDVNNPEEARLLCSRDISMDKTSLSKKTLKEMNTQLELESLSGYSIKDISSEAQLYILSISYFPSGLMATCLYAEKEYFIPLEEQWIKNIDHTGKIIIMHLPEGILEL